MNDNFEIRLQQWAKSGSGRIVLAVVHGVLFGVCVVNVAISILS